jgi:sn-glycerol 3-phosphate transport system substrate-binding protein
MTAVNNEWVNDLAKQFNESQKEYKVVPTFKGVYDESMTAAIAAFRSGNAPHILQVFEVGTATMMASKGATVPVRVMPTPASRSTPRPTSPPWPVTTPAPNGQMLSFPFNSSTTIFYYNKDAFKKAGLNPDVAPKTWPEVCCRQEAQGKRPQLPHDPGLARLDPAGVLLHLAQRGIRHRAQRSERQWLQGAHEDQLASARQAHRQPGRSRAGEFVYKGRASTAQASFTAGECAMIQTSSGFYGDVAKNAKFNYALAPCPTTPMSRARPRTP